MTRSGRRAARRPAAWVVRTVLTCAAVALPGAALAGSFSVAPIRIELDARAKTAVLKVTNTGAEKVSVQVIATAWRQEATGSDQYEPTRELVVFPKIVAVEADKEASVRIGYQGPAGREGERAYRLFVQELPVARPGETAVSVAVGFSVPVFVKPGRVHPGQTLEALELAEGTLSVSVRNSGNRHLQVSTISTEGRDAGGAVVFTHDVSGWYVLPGVTRRYVIPIPADECAKATVIRVTVNLADALSLEARLPVAPARCAR